MTYKHKYMDWFITVPVQTIEWKLILTDVDWASAARKTSGMGLPSGHHCPTWILVERGRSFKGSHMEILEGFEDFEVFDPCQWQTQWSPQYMVGGDTTWPEIFVCWLHIFGDGAATQYCPSCR